MRLRPPPADHSQQGTESLAPILLSSLSPPTSHKPPERLRHPPSPQNVVMTKHCMFFGVITLLVATVDALDEGPASLDLASARDELLHSRNRIKVLEDELTRRAAQEELQAGVARVFKLSSSWSAGEARAVQLSIEAQEPATEWLCSSASVAHVFQILLSTADGIPLSAALLAGCPRSGAPVRFSLSAATVHAWEQHALTSEEELGAREYNTNELAQAKLAAAAAAQSRDASILTRLRRAFSSMGGRRLGATTGDDDGRLRARHAAHLPLSVCVRVEAFNSDADDMARTGDLRKYLAIRNPADLNPARGIALGCSRFTVLAARQQPVVGCFNVSSGGRAADPAAAPAHGGHGRPREFNAGANSVGDRTGRTDRTDRDLDGNNTSSSSVLLPPREDGAISPPKWRPAWVRVLGDSVTHGALRAGALQAALRRAYPPHDAAGGASEWLAVTSEALNPLKPTGQRWELICEHAPADPASGKKRTWRLDPPHALCVSYEPWYDGPSPSLNVPGPPPRLETFVRNATAGRHLHDGRLTYLSLGSHGKILGGDAEAERRLAVGMRAMLQAQQDAVGAATGSTRPPPPRVVLALETARANYATPAKFAGSSPASAFGCQLSNMRVHYRNVATRRAFTTACTAQSARCAVLDLFAASLPLIFDAEMFKEGDPIHPRDYSFVVRPAAEAFVDRELVAFT